MIFGASLMVGYKVLGLPCLEGCLPGALDSACTVLHVSFRWPPHLWLILSYGSAVDRRTCWRRFLGI